MKIKIFELISGAREAEGLAVIIDVFRAFSLESYLFGQGAAGICAVKSVDAAFALKKRHPDWLLAGERGGRKVEGFDFGNSPSAFAGMNLTGKTIIHTTSSGTQGLAAAAGADEILAGSLVNARATAKCILKKQSDTVSLVAMGNSGIRTAEEDVLCARYIASILENDPIDVQPLADKLAETAGRKFFDPAQADVFPKADFALCTACDRFSFAIKAEKADGYFRMRPITLRFFRSQDQRVSYSAFFRMRGRQGSSRCGIPHRRGQR